MTDPSCEILDWDSAFFGFRIARVSGPIRTSAAMQGIIHWCVEQQVCCLYYLAPSDDPSIVPITHDYRFSLVDIRITYQRSTHEIPLAAGTVRPAREEDVPHLAAIAKFAHTDSRFFYDPHFSRDQCAHLYSLWIEKSCHGYANRVLVVDRNGEPSGYVTCHHDSGVGEIGLLALAPDARGTGLGRVLVTQSLSYFHQCGIQNVEVITQARNIPAQRLYQQCGFKTSKVELWYHRWF